jgi:hypothetical protein
MASGDDNDAMLIRRSADFKPVRVQVAADAAKDWVINDIRIGNVMVPPPTDEDRAREAEAAERHDPMIARTLMGGPGNRRRILGCACRDKDVHDAKTWAAHIGIPGGERFIDGVLALQDAAQDAIDYPGEETLASLSTVLKWASP